MSRSTHKPEDIKAKRERRRQWAKLLVRRDTQAMREHLALLDPEPVPLLSPAKGCASTRALVRA